MVLIAFLSAHSKTLGKLANACMKIIRALQPLSRLSLVDGASKIEVSRECIPSNVEYMYRSETRLGG
jgi:hypothetical protein